MREGTQWCVAWNAATRSLRALPLVEHLRRVNGEIVAGVVPAEHAVAVMDTLEAACGYERELKRVLRRRAELEKGTEHGREGQTTGTTDECEKGVPEGSVQQAGGHSG